MKVVCIKIPTEKNAHKKFTIGKLYNCEWHKIFDVGFYIIDNNLYCFDQQNMCGVGASIYKVNLDNYGQSVITTDDFLENFACIRDINIDELLKFSD